MSSQVYGLKELKSFLGVIDSHLDEQTEIIVIGGTAALLAYKATRLTQDIDSFSKISSRLQRAYEQAKLETGIDVPLSQAGVADAPYNFEHRLLLYQEREFQYLRILVPEIHDYILMKTVRGYEHDLEVIEEIACKNEVKKEILVQRFEDEMKQAIGDQKRLRYNFAATLSRCFGEKVADAWLKGKK